MSAPLAKALEDALEGRADHAECIGITSKAAWVHRGRRRIYFRHDYLLSERLRLGSVPEDEANAATAALLKVMEHWREYVRCEKRSLPGNRIPPAQALAARAAAAG